MGGCHRGLAEETRLRGRAPVRDTKLAALLGQTGIAFLAIITVLRPWKRKPPEPLDIALNYATVVATPTAISLQLSPFQTFNGCFSYFRMLMASAALGVLILYVKYVKYDKNTRHSHFPLFE